MSRSESLQQRFDMMVHGIINREWRNISHVTLKEYTKENFSEILYEVVEGTMKLNLEFQRERSGMLFEEFREELLKHVKSINNG